MRTTSKVMIMPKRVPKEMFDITEDDYPITCKARTLFELQVAVTTFLDKESGTLAQIKTFFGRSSMNELIQEMLYRGMFELKGFMEQAMEEEKKEPKEDIIPDDAVLYKRREKDES